MSGKTPKKRKMRTMPVLKPQVSVERRIRTRSTPPTSQNLYEKSNEQNLEILDELDSEPIRDPDPHVLEAIQNIDRDRSSSSAKAGHAKTHGKEFDSVRASIESVASGGGSISSKDLTDDTTIFCTLPWCNGSSLDPDICFVSFPKMKKKRLLKWAAALRWDDLKRQTICSLHFDSEKDFIVKEDGKKILMPGAVPSRNWNPQEKEIVESDQENQELVAEEFYAQMDASEEEPYPLMSYLYSKSLTLKEEIEIGEKLSLEVSARTDDDEAIHQFEQSEIKDSDQFENSNSQEPESLVVEISLLDYVLSDETNHETSYNDSSETLEAESIETDSFGSIWSPSKADQTEPLTSSTVQTLKPMQTSTNRKRVRKPTPKSNSKNFVNIENGTIVKPTKEKKAKVRHPPPPKKPALDAAKKDLIIEALRSSRNNICTQYDISEMMLEKIWSSHIREKRQQESSKKQKQQQQQHEQITKLQEEIKETNAEVPPVPTEPEIAEVN